MEHTTTLDRIGDILEHAMEDDLGPRRRRKPILVAVLAAVVIIPAGAYAGSKLISTNNVARSIPAGTFALAGTSPSCTTVTEGVEYHCLLAKPPAPEVSDWKGTVETTVDTTSHVNGGCRSLNSPGTEWECYLGQQAVTQGIIATSVLGTYQSGPGAG
jgi:hypothetical protein